MKPPKRPWKRAEKLLLVSPLLIVIASGGMWLWRRNQSKIFVNDPDLRFVSDARFSPDGRRLAVIYCGGDPLVARGAVFDVESRIKICDLNTPKDFESEQHLEWSPNGKQIVAGYGLGKIGMWDSQNGALSEMWSYGGMPNGIDVSSLSFSSDGTKIIGEEIPATIFDAPTGTPLRRFVASSGASGYGYFNSTDKLIAVENLQATQLELRDVSSNRMIKAWDLSKKRVKGTWLQVGGLQWSWDDVLVFQEQLNQERPLGNSFLPLTFWDSRAKKPLLAPSDPNPRKFSLCPTSSLIAINSYGTREEEDGSMSVWNYRQGKYFWKSSLKKIVRDFRWSFDGKYLAILEEDDSSRLLQIFDINGRIILEQNLDIGLNSLDWSPNSEKLAIAQDDGIALVEVK